MNADGSYTCSCLDGYAEMERPVQVSGCVLPWLLMCVLVESRFRSICSYFFNINNFTVTITFKKNK